MKRFKVLFTVIAIALGIFTAGAINTNAPAQALNNVIQFCETGNSQANFNVAMRYVSDGTAAPAAWAYPNQCLGVNGDRANDRIPFAFYVAAGWCAEWFWASAPNDHAWVVGGASGKWQFFEPTPAGSSGQAWARYYDC